ncbi:hypothetical protein [Microbispora catharanthi]|uniref:Uncharacterized protein n=1 Tax=Microbispora catharanthi TaxID=1712871 RepID=A0A5N6BTA6_9ACTN|nr:hypothetical protein [Microbispora catharanthi]KAB8183687.1 hypothetical protein FH610_018650 [Microbispora catharanthi]
MAIDLEAWTQRLFVLRDGGDFLDDPLDSVLSLTEFLTAAGRVAETYSTQRIADGLWFLADDSGLFRELYNPSVPENLRVRCAAAIRQLYAQLFERLCRNSLSHGDNGYSVENPLNSICYMWWDVFPTWGRPGDPVARRVDEVLLGVMRDTLPSENVACVESALHGLGHWHVTYSDVVESIVEEFLRQRPAIGGSLRDYARAARRGRVL